MKLFRTLLTGLLVAMAVLAVLAGIAFLPVFQTWIGQIALGRQPELHGSLGSLSIGLTEVEIEDLRLEFGSRVLTVPSLQAKVRLSDWLPGRTFHIQGLVAKGWILDLPRGGPMPASVAAPGVPVPESDASASPVDPTAGASGAADGAVPGGPAAPATALPSWLARWTPPRPVSLDGLDTAGEIRVGGGGAAGVEPVRIQVSAQGGGLSAGSEGSFTVDGAASGPGLPANTLTAHGRLAVAMPTAQAVTRVALTADLVAQGGALPRELHESVLINFARGQEQRILYSLELGSGGRRLVVLKGAIAGGDRPLTGAWQIDLQSSDFRPFAPDLPSPEWSAAGQGDYAWDVAAGRARAFGRLEGSVSQWEAWRPSLKPIGPTRFSGRFDATHAGTALRVDAGAFELSGAGPSCGLSASVRALQPFTIDERTGEVATAPSPADWIEVSISGLPLMWFSGLSDDWTLTGGNAAAKLRVQRAPGGFALRTLIPATASGVSVQGLGRTLGTGLDLTLAATAERSSGGWRIRAAPLAIRQRGRALATIEARISRSAEAEAAVVAAGTWNADLAAWAASPAGSADPWLRGQSAAGDFNLNLGAGSTLEGALTVTGHAPGNSLTTHVRAQIEADRTVTFRAPLVLKLGAAATDLSVDGSWIDDAGDGRLELSVTGEDVSLEQLRALLAPWTGGATQAPAATASSAAPRAALPFWGGWVGRAAFALKRLRTGGQDYSAVGGSVEFDHGVLRLKGGRGELPPHRQLSWDGAIAFDGAAYTLAATAGAADVDAATLIPARKDGEDPIIEGHFSVARTLAGSGGNLADLLRSTRATIRVKSSDGIIRWFKTNVGDAITQASTPATDALGSVGSAVGSLFGVRRGTLEAVKNPLSPTAEAVLEFSNQVAEFGYDTFTATAVEQPDGSFRVTALELKAPAEQVTGSGTFGGRRGLPFSAQPLALDLQFGARGRIGQLLAQGGLALDAPAASDLKLLAATVHFGGTLEQLDSSPWHDLLARAARQPPKKKP